MNTFTALADKTRREIVLIVAREGEVTVARICDNFDISPPAVSQHLKILKEAKVLKVSKMAQKRIYSIDRSAFNEMEDWLSEVKNLWNRRLDSLDQYLTNLKNEEDKK